MPGEGKPLSRFFSNRMKGSIIMADSVIIYGKAG